MPEEAWCELSGGYGNDVFHLFWPGRPSPDDRFCVVSMKRFAFAARRFVRRALGRQHYGNV